MTVDWTAIGTAIAAIVTGVGGWLIGRKPNQAKADAAIAQARAEGAQATAEKSIVDLLRQEVERLGKRVEALEGEQRELRASSARQVRHIFRLESLMRAAGMEPPHFDIDGDAASVQQ